MLGLTFSDSTLQGLVETMGTGVLRPTEPATIVTANLDHIVMLTKNAEFRQA